MLIFPVYQPTMVKLLCFSIHLLQILLADRDNTWVNSFHTEIHNNNLIWAQTKGCLSPNLDDAKSGGCSKNSRLKWATLLHIKSSTIPFICQLILTVFTWMTVVIGDKDDCKSFFFVQNKYHLHYEAIIQNTIKSLIYALSLVGKKLVNHSDIVGASPVGVAPTISSFTT